MRKRIKLLLSIATFCFAIIILSFGVYAASTVTYTASGTVTYNVSSVFCKISTTYSYVTNEELIHSSFDEESWELLLASGGDYSWSTPATKVGNDYDTGLDPDYSGNATNSTSIDINFNTSSLYKIMVTVVCYKQSSQIRVAPSLTRSLVNANINLLTSENLSINCNTDDETARTRQVVYYVALSDVTAAASGSFGIQVDVSKAS